MSETQDRGLKFESYDEYFAKCLRRGGVPLMRDEYESLMPDDPRWR